jgi:LytS/YehU family sensor histidine kinase
MFYSIYIYQIRKLKTKQVIREQLALSQITALRTQMNPHFMFNILNAFQGLIYTNQKTKANEYLGVFSDLMRKTLDMSDQREVTIEEELSAIELYIQLEQARFDAGDFEYTLVTNNRDELKDFLIPSLILQPFIENAIKHGLLHQVGVKKLRLCIFRENDNYWNFEIEDNGIGREKSAERNKKFQKHKSFATKSIDTRIELINKLSKKAIILDVIDLKNKDNKACGTRIVLRIPIKIK